MGKSYEYVIYHMNILGVLILFWKNIIANSGFKGIESI